MNTDYTVSESKWKNTTTQSEIVSNNRMNTPQRFTRPSTIRVDKSNQVASSSVVPIVLVYEDFRIGDTLVQKPVIIDISKEDMGSFWMPLVKIGRYDIRITLKKDYRFDHKNSNTTININGIVRLNGNYKILGICNSKKAKKLVINKILNDFYEEVKKGINEASLNAKKFK